jgi:selenide,water dikinase
LLWVTGVRAPAWPRASGLAVDEHGFVRVDRQLRSVSHPAVFAAGDLAHLTGQERPKSGVYAVRAGPVLAANLRRAIRGQALRPFRAQRQALALIGTGDRRAIASRGWFCAEGRWVWWWKDWIDRRFMARFCDLPVLAPMRPEGRSPTGASALIDPMRCGGCGAKLGAEPLRRVLARLPSQRFAGVLAGIGDDAALIEGSTDPLVLTTDGFRAMLDDPWRFGRIAAHHSLNDVYAMGAVPTTAMALATVPLMAEQMMEEELHQMLLGAVEVLNEAGVALVGGHSAEGAELALGLAVTGRATAPVLYKHGGRPGDALIVTKALGVGVLLAAHMRGAADTAELGVAITTMDHSNAAALDVLRRHDVSALTDVSGFGLAGHLGEMMRASGVGATIDVAAVPALAGALRCVREGAVSVLQANNELALADFGCKMAGVADPRVRLLADPQTSGGLLAAVPASNADDCVAELKRAGYVDSAIIGVLTAGAATLEGVVG